MKKTLFLLAIFFSSSLFSDYVPIEPPELTVDIINKSIVVLEPNQSISIIYDEELSHDHFIKWVLKDKNIVKITIQSPEGNSNYTKWVYDDSLRLDKTENNYLESFVKINKDDQIFWENKDNLQISGQIINEELLELVKKQLKEETP